MIVNFGGLAFVLAVWCWAWWEYRHVFRRPLRWWAAPFALGSLLFSRLLPDWCHADTRDT